MSREVYLSWGLRLSALALFLLPFKLTLGYFGLIPLISWWLINNYKNIRLTILESPSLYPMLAFFFVAITTSIFGINPERSFTHIGTLVFFPLAIFAFRDVLQADVKIPLRALLLGACGASLVRICEHIVPSLNPKFLGAVSQAGQFTLILPIALGFFEYLEKTEPTVDLEKRKFLGALAGVLGVLGGFFDKLHIPPMWGICLLAFLVGYFLLTLYQWIRGSTSFQALLVGTLVPLIVATLVVNLKRGPWLGIGIGISIFLWFYSRRTLLFVTTICGLCIFLEPVQTRIEASMNHFFIAGGRSAIWDIGGELLKNYPLGIGFENSGFLRSFSQEIPLELKHFHNNLLNVAVELGWLGLVTYIVAFFSIIKSALRSGILKNNPLCTAAGCGLIAWQVAGLVEYNFGDAAVVALGYFAIALALATSNESAHSKLVETRSSH